MRTGGTACTLGGTVKAPSTLGTFLRSFRWGQELGLNEDELAFYDALETNDSAVKVLGDETLRTIAQELVETVRRNATIDWTVRESVRAGMRNAVRRVLRKHGYPPDKEKKAIDTVIEQAELLSEEWTNI